MNIPAAMLAIGVMLVSFPLHAQQDRLRTAFDLERRGSYAEAVDAYRAALATKPSDVQALLGLERVLLPLGRSEEILPPAEAAMAADSTNVAIYGVALRGWGAAQQRDSVRAIAERWARLAPDDEAPYREWGATAIAMRDRAGAVTAYRLGRERLGRSNALAAEIAQLAAIDRDYATAIREWILALEKIPEYRSAAAAALAEAPEDARPALLDQVTRNPSPAARLLEADLRARWGDPLAGFEVLQRALPNDRARAAAVLKGFVEEIRLFAGGQARRAEGRALEALAERSPLSQSSRFRLEAAEAYAQGADRNAARRMLAGLADDPTAPGAVAAQAGATLVAILIGEGKVPEAASRLAELRPMLAVDRYRALQRDLALGWARTGALTRADSALAGDSSVQGLAISGWLRLYRGDVAGAVRAFLAAGPFAGDRADATQRTLLLAVLQPIEADSVPELGPAFLKLSQGDTAEALDAFERVARTLPPAHGGAELQLYAGGIAAAARRPDDAERLFRAAAIPDAPGTAPAAELALGELLLKRGRSADAMQILEHLILRYPNSALVAQARRKLDEARGAVPKT